MLNSASDLTKSERNTKMKKTAIVLMALIAAVAILFTACGNKMDNDMTTTLPNTTEAPSVTVPGTDNDILTTDNDSTAYNGAPESTNRDSALGDAVEDAAEGAADANERIADGVREAEERNNAR